MMNNLMPKIAEMLGVKLGETVTIENVDNPNFSWKVRITTNGLEFDKKDLAIRPKKDFAILPNEEASFLVDWLRGLLRIRNSFPKDGDKVFSVVTKGIFNEHGYPRIEEFEFDSSSQFHLLLKDKGLLHETLEEAVKCFEKDYNMFKEMREDIKN